MQTRSETKRVMWQKKVSFSGSGTACSIRGSVASAAGIHRVWPTMLSAGLLVLTGIFFIAEAGAQSAAEKGMQIARDAYAADDGFENFTADLTMLLRNKQGQEHKRNLRIKVLEVKGDGDKSLFIFDNPRDVKGTAMLIHGRRDQADDLWLYLPALKRVKRISSSNRSGSFVGSEFAYEDLGRSEVKKFTYTWLRDEPCGSMSCTVNELRPTQKGSGYSRQLVWRDTDELRIWKIEYYDRKNSHLKTLTNGDFKQHRGKFWRPGQSNMVNHVTGKSTELVWENYDFGARLNKQEFSQTGLRRIR